MRKEKVWRELIMEGLGTKEEPRRKKRERKIGVEEEGSRN